MSQASTLEAGPEMDRAVAAACGIEVTSYHYGCPDYIARVVNPTVTAGWKPSTDWNDAMLAAERFGLFDHDKDNGAILFWAGGDWHVQNHKKRLQWWASDDEYAQDYFIADATTGPLAICRAILTLSASLSETQGDA